MIIAIVCYTVYHLFIPRSPRVVFRTDAGRKLRSRRMRGIFLQHWRHQDAAVHPLGGHISHLPRSMDRQQTLGDPNEANLKTSKKVIQTWFAQQFLFEFHLFRKWKQSRCSTPPAFRDSPWPVVESISIRGTHHEDQNHG